MELNWTKTIFFLYANCGRLITGEVDKYYFQTTIHVEKLSLANDHVTYMVISVQSQNIINGKDSEETYHVVSLPSTCH